MAAGVLRAPLRNSGWAPQRSNSLAHPVEGIVLVFTLFMKRICAESMLAAEKDNKASLADTCGVFDRELAFTLPFYATYKVESNYLVDGLQCDSQDPALIPLKARGFIKLGKDIVARSASLEQL